MAEMSVVVGDRYRFERELGTGGSATVWCVHDLALDRPAALKLLLPLERGGDSRRDRLRTEARALAALDHRHVVRVFDLGQHEGRDYIVMEYLERGSLADRLANEGPLAPLAAVDAVLDVLEALAAAHDGGIVHRDVKPGNVLVRADGTVALCDFGIARTQQDGPDGEHTRTGVALGSLGFMAPEQRIDARRAGPQADLYSAACTLFNLVTADTPVDLYLAADTSPRWEAVPAALKGVLRRATRSEPSQRYATALEMADALRAVRPALVGLPAARRSGFDPHVGAYPPTRHSGEAPVWSTATAEPSLEAERRGRHVDPDDWGWAHRKRAPVGRTAVWVGIATTALASSVGLASGPMRDWFQPMSTTTLSAPEVARDPIAGPIVAGVVGSADVQAIAPKPAMLALQPSQLAGTWRGTVDGNPGTLVLTVAHGASDGHTLDGELELRLGIHELKSRLHGGFDPELGALELSEPEGAPNPSRYVARPSASALILEGEVERADGARLPFALVRTE